MKYTFLAILSLLAFAACKTTQPTSTANLATPGVPETEMRNLDTLVISAPRAVPDKEEIPNDLPVYRATQSMAVDILHTKLDLKFNWTEEAVMGKATIAMRPYFAPIKEVVLDAKGFDIHSIRLLNNGEALDHRYDGSLLTVDLDQFFHRHQTINLYIDYTAHPSEGENGSAAITSDKGLFFINPRGDDPTKPQQIWTQGETEFNSRWFPTLDQPNERCTQEVLLTVADRFKTLSNGALISSVSNPDGTRTDHWKMDQPHAPYLFMVAVGEFAVVSDTWRDKPIDYYVEEDYREDAKDIFAHTPEMLTFFSDLVDMEYPWNKYSQVVVREYVSGAMENTTAVIYGDFVQRNKRALIDEDNDYIVAHELFHHWFGDYVTCESWSNLTLNEGFANYAEYLWFEHKYGLDRAANHRLQEIEGYLFQASQEIHPLIDFAYQAKEAMFDQHSYNKGGLVLHMLRHIVGDEAFFASLNHYLKENALTAVEVHDLRMAFEDITGVDLNWFFNQWYLSAGHPIIEMDYQWNDSLRQLLVQIEQKQDPENSPAIFRIPTELDLQYSDGSHERIKITIDQRVQELSFPLVEAPALVVLDPERVQLAIINCAYTPKEYALMYADDAALELRLKAISSLANSADSISQLTVERALDDPFWAVRRRALSSVDWDNRIDLQDKLADLAGFDAHSLVRSEAIFTLAALENASDYKEIFIRGINNEDAYPIVGASIRSLYEVDPDLCTDKISLLLEEEHAEIVAAVSSIYGDSKDTVHLSYFENHMQSVSGLPALDFYANFDALLQSLSKTSRTPWLEKAKEVAVDQGTSPYTRIAATRMIISHLGRARRDSSQEQKIQGWVDEIMQRETNDQVKSIYQNFLGS